LEILRRHSGCVNSSTRGVAANTFGLRPEAFVGVLLIAETRRNPRLRSRNPCACRRATPAANSRESRRIMKPPIIGQKVNDQAIDSLIDALDGLADAEAVLYVGYPVAATADAPITVPALLISEKIGFVCFDVVPSAKGSEVPQLKLKQRAIVLAL